MRGGRLKRCYGISETAACSQGHPYVPVNPETQTNNFQSPVIFVIRNVAYEFPATMTDKAMAYHGGAGQISQENWKNARSEWLEGSITAWKDMIRWWKNADYYQIVLYLPFEHMLDAERGPKLVARLADVYRSAGFDVAPEADLPCLWYQSVYKEWERQSKLTSYVPAYTESQKNLLVNEMASLIEEFAKDHALSSILKEYYQEIRDNLKVDAS